MPIPQYNPEWDIAPPIGSSGAELMKRELEKPTREKYYSTDTTAKTPETLAESGWDYSNPPVDQITGNPIGPGGEPLPAFAKGWRPDGTPDFGSTQLLKFNEGNLTRRDSGARRQQGLYSLNPEFFVSKLRKYASNIAEAWKSGYNEEFVAPTVSETAFTGTKRQEFIKTGTEEKLAEQRAQVKPEVTEGTYGEKLKGNFGRYLNAAAGATVAAFNQLLQAGLDLIQTPAEISENALGTLYLAGRDKMKGETPDWEQNLNTSQMIYASILPRFFSGKETALKGTKRAEFIAGGVAKQQEILEQSKNLENRMTELVDSGLRPDLAEDILMDENKWAMWPELVGQIAIDPLNYIGAPLKAAANAKRLNNIRKQFENADDVAEVVLRLSKYVDDVGGISSSAKAEELTGLVTDLLAKQSKTAGIIDDSRFTRKIFAWKSKTDRAQKINQLTMGARASNFYNVVHDALMTVTKFAKSPDDALEMVEALKKASQAADALKAGDVALANRLMTESVITRLSFNAPNMMFSNAMEELGHFLNHADLDEINKILKSGKSMDEMIPLLNDVTQRGIAGTFPTIEEMLAAEKRLAETKGAKKLAGAAEDIAKGARKLTRDEELVEMLDKIPAWQVSIAKANASAIAKGWKKTQSALSYIQLNSVGFAMRNFFNAELTTLVDEGFDALVGSQDELARLVTELHGSDLIGNYGFGPRALTEDVVELAGEDTTFAKGIREAVKNKDLRALAAVLESGGAKRVMAHRYLKEWNKLIGLIPDEARALGVADDIAIRLPDILTDAGGDVKKAMAKVGEMVDAKVIDLYSSTDNIPTELVDFLKERGSWEKFRAGVLDAKKLGTKDNAHLASQAMFDNWISAGDKSFVEGAPISDSIIRQAVDEGAMSGLTGQIVDQQKDARRKFAEAVGDAWDNAKISLPPAERKALGIPGTLRAWGDEATQKADEYNKITWEAHRAGKKPGANFAELWEKYIRDVDGSVMPVPKNISSDVYYNALWGVYRPTQSTRYSKAVQTPAENILKELKKRKVQIPPELQKNIDEAYERMIALDNVGVGRYGNIIKDVPVTAYGTRSTQISSLANKYGYATAKETEAGQTIFFDKSLLKTINEWARVPGGYKSLEEIPLSVADEALKSWAMKHGKIVEAVPEVGKVAENIPQTTRIADDLVGVPSEKIPYVTPSVEPMSGRGVLPESAAKTNLKDRERIERMRELADNYIEDNFGKQKLFSETVDMKALESLLNQRTADAKQVAAASAKAARDFTMLDYSGDKTFVDLALAYIMPYHFWYGRTYVNWVSRVAQNPTVLAAYAKYKKNLAAIHAGMPEFYKYTLSTNDLPGIDMENPLYFNLEATLWPLNGITGVDFNDPKKRVDWWTNMLDFSGRFGPTVYTPIQIATGLYYYQKGKREGNDELVEAGRRWMGRLVPQTKLLKNIGAYIEEKTGVDLPGRFNELDPLVGLIQNGLDPYEERQASRALAAMQQEAFEGRSQYTPEQIAEAGYTHKGVIWEEAVRRAMSERMWPQLSSFFMGVGFKGRTQQDMQNDKFYTEYSRVMSMRSALTSEEWRTAMTDLQTKYPFMDTLLISNRVGMARDAGYAYSVLSRIPPAKTDNYAKMVGLDYDYFQKFWDDKGAIETWAESDQKKFMAGILDLAAILEIPDASTKAEWTEAKNLFTGMITDMDKKFGAGTSALVDEYNALKYADVDAANDLLDSHQVIQQALDWKAQRIMGSPLLSDYYASYTVVSEYYNSLERIEVLDKCGKDFYEILSEYYAIKDTIGGDKAAATFKKQYKARFDTYYDISAKYTAMENAKLAALAKRMSGVDAKIREDYDSTQEGMGAESLGAGITPQEVIPLEQWEQMLTPEIYRLIIDNLENQTPFDYDISQELEDIAKYKLQQYGLEFWDADALVQAVGQSYYK